MRKSEMLVVAMVLLSFAAAFYLYPGMPDEMASHWDIRGQVDGYMSKFWGLFLMPIICVVMLALFMVLPRVDPLKENLKEFRNYFDGFIVMIFLFMFYIYALTIAWNSGAMFDMFLALPPAFAILFFYCGILISKAKRNWFIGIRTPWTLSNDAVWEKTHRLGGRLFKVAGVVSLAGVLFQDLAFFFVILPMLLAALYLVVFSYVEYQKETKGA